MVTVCGKVCSQSLKSCGSSSPLHNRPTCEILAVQLIRRLLISIHTGRAIITEPFPCMLCPIQCYRLKGAGPCHETRDSGVWPTVLLQELTQ